MTRYYVTPDKDLYIKYENLDFYFFDQEKKEWIKDADLGDIWYGERWVDEITEQEALDGIAARENCAANSN